MGVLVDEGDDFVVVLVSQDSPEVSLGGHTVSNLGLAWVHVS